MTIELDWQEGDNPGDVNWLSGDQVDRLAPSSPATIAQGLRPAGRLPTLPRRVLLILGLVLAAALTAAVPLLWQADRGSEQARQDIESTARLLLSAGREGDRDLYASLLDTQYPSWREDKLAALSSQTSSALPAEVRVDSVILANNRATAELVESLADGSTQHKLVFFHRQGPDSQWQLSPPWPDAFGDPTSITSPHFRLQFRERDAPWASYLVNSAEGAYVALCGQLACPSDNRLLELQLVYEADPPNLPDHVLALPSPWLVGIREDDRPADLLHERLIDQLAQHLARLRASTASPALLQAIGQWAIANVLDQQGKDAILNQALAANALMPLDAAWATVAVNNDTDNALAVAQVSSLLQYLGERAGSDAPGRLLAGLSQHIDLYTLLNRSLNASLPEVQAGWLAWIGAGSEQLPWQPAPSAAAASSVRA